AFAVDRLDREQVDREPAVEIVDRGPRQYPLGVEPDFGDRGRSFRQNPEALGPARKRQSLGLPGEVEAAVTERQALERHTSAAFSRDRESAGARPARIGRQGDRCGETYGERRAQRERLERALPAPGRGATLVGQRQRTLCCERTAR